MLLRRAAQAATQQLIPQLSLLGPLIANGSPAAAAAMAAQGQSLLGQSSSSSQLQQQRCAAKKKAAQPTKKKGDKKGQQQAGKKSKQKMDTKPFDEKDPMMQKLIAMLVPAAEPQQRTYQQQLEGAKAAREYRRQHNRQHAAWSSDLRRKLELKVAALQALPPGLRQAAEVEDLTPFPLTRHFLYDSPPDAYKQ